MIMTMKLKVDYPLNLDGTEPDELTWDCGDCSLIPMNPYVTEVERNGDVSIVTIRYPHNIKLRDIDSDGNATPWRSPTVEDVHWAMGINSGYPGFDHCLSVEYDDAIKTKNTTYRTHDEVDVAVKAGLITTRSGAWSCPASVDGLPLGVKQRVESSSRS